MYIYSNKKIIGGLIIMERPSYFAVIPASVRYDERLKPSEKILYAEITALINIKGYCYATNQYFSKLYGVHKNSISIWINNLIKCGYLKVKYVIREIEGQKRQERRIYVVKRKEIKKEIETIQEKIVSESVKECEDDRILEEEKSEEKEECKEKLEEVAQKNLGGSQKEIIGGTNKKLEKINTSRLVQEDYILHTHSQGESEKFPVIREILEKYNQVGLPSFEFPPDNYIILKAYGELGASGVFKALEIMGESEFVKNNMSVNTIFKLENLKKALNGSFKNRDSRVYFEREKKCEKKESENEKKRDRELEEFLNSNPDNRDDIPELFSSEELFDRN